MNCLCCGKPFGPKVSEAEHHSGWHTACINRFFGTKQLPQIEVTPVILEQLAKESTRLGLTVPGVQKKLSLHLTPGDYPRLTLINYPTGYILKPQAEPYQSLPEAEDLVMRMAVRTGIQTVPFALIRVSTADQLAYITKRVDRIFPLSGKDSFQMLAMEDFCQLDERLTQNKYRSSYERCARIISRYSARPGLDLSELFLRLVFCFAVGNSDMHLKNFSLLETAPGKATYILSPAYDLLPVNIILPDDRDQFALTMNGKRRNLHRKDFLTYANAIHLHTKTAENLLLKVISLRDTYLEMCRASLLPTQMQETLADLIVQRCEALG